MQPLDEREHMLLHRVVHALRREVMKDAPLQLLARNGPLADLHIPREDAFSRYRLHFNDSINLYTIRPRPEILPRAQGNEKGAVARKHFRADSPVFFDLNHGHLTLAIIMA